MKRLNFHLHDFMRIAWVSNQAREIWQPRINKIIEVNERLEWLAVVEGIRPCAFTSLTPEDYVQIAPEWAMYGLSGFPVSMEGVSPYSYSNTGLPWKAGEPFVYRIVIGRPEGIKDFITAWNTYDHRTVGRLLGYPECCSEFFTQTWINQKMIDTTWPMAVGSLGDKAEEAEKSYLAEVSGPPEANVLGRWLGVRAAIHLPCSFNCQPTLEVGRQIIALGRKYGYDQEMDDILEILSWPMEWTAMHGIAEVKTPILKFIAQTDATPVKYTVRYQGKHYPQEGTRGIGFPFQSAATRHVLDNAAYKRGLEHPIGKDTIPYPNWYASDNGFNTRFAMDSAHRPIVALAISVLKGKGGNVMDPGCGNGLLMKKIVDAAPGIIPFGVEYDAARFQHIQQVIPEFAQNFVVGDMFDNEDLWAEGRHYNLVVLYPGRLLEVSAERAAAFRQKLQSHCDAILVYTYPDAYDLYGNLGQMCALAGLRLLEANPNVEVGLGVITDQQSAIADHL